jgi:hypothetical protein
LPDSSCLRVDRNKAIKLEQWPGLRKTDDIEAQHPGKI